MSVGVGQKMGHNEVIVDKFPSHGKISDILATCKER
jgi:hypothetical protein